MDDLKTHARRYFKQLDFARPESYDAELVESLLERNEAELTQGIAKVCFSYVDGLQRFRGKSSAANLTNFLAQIPEGHLKQSKMLGYFKDYLSCLTAMRAVIEEGNRKVTQEVLVNQSHAMAELAPPAARAVQVLEQINTQGALLLLGQLHSFVNRAKARECFMAASQGLADIIESIGLDTGCLTYFSDIDEDLAQSRLATIHVKPLSGSEQGRGPCGVVISVDDRFFRIYGPLLLLYAHHLHQQHFHIVFVGSGAEAERAVELAERSQSLLRDCTGRPPGNNLSIHHCEVPTWVANPRTFYACARFLAMPALLNQHEAIYVMDADSYINEDVAPLFADLSEEADLAIPINQGYAGLAPWRRCLAGRVFAKRTPKVFELIPAMNEYIAYGLSEPRSWMLDQNAIAYALEMHPEVKFADHNLIGRVTSRPTLFNTFEKNVARKKSWRADS
jgi:hypothetical protein